MSTIIIFVRWYTLDLKCMTKCHKEIYHQSIQISTFIIFISYLWFFIDKSFERRVHASMSLGSAHKSTLVICSGHTMHKTQMLSFKDNKKNYINIYYMSVSKSYTEAAILDMKFTYNHTFHSSSLIFFFSFVFSTQSTETGLRNYTLLLHSYYLCFKQIQILLFFSGEIWPEVDYENLIQSY